MQRWSLMQTEILLCFNDDFGILTAKLEKQLEWLQLMFGILVLSADRLMRVLA